MSNRLLFLPVIALVTHLVAGEPDPRTAPLAAEHPRYLEVSLPVDERVADLVSRLTLEEKAAALNHNGPDLDRIGLRSDKWNQCLNGVQWTRPTTLFPTCVALAATWNPEFVQHDVARVISDEARAIYNAWHLDPTITAAHKGLIYRAPVINIERNPYWGRNHEAWGEDPFLTGRMAVAYVRGIQGDDPHYLKIAATLKHFAVNNVETDRVKLSAQVSERMLREYWLPHFRDAVVEGKACSLMASYNAINGTPNNINHWLLTDLLKNEWHHEGFVVSDLGGVKTMVEGHEANQMTYVDAVARSLMAGCDFSDKEFQANIPAAVRAGKLSEARLDDALTRVLRVRFRLGEFDPFASVPYSRISPAVINSAEHRKVALQAAQQAIVLLQNRDHLLPLDKSRLKHIAVIGPLADQELVNNYNGQRPKMITVLQGIKDRARTGAEVTYVRGGIVGGQPNKWVPSEAGIDPAAELKKAVETARGADVVVLCVGTNAGIELEGRDRKFLGLPGTQQELAEAVLAANPRTVVVELSAGPLVTPWLKAKAPALLQAWWPGEEGGHAIADVLFGNVNPGGRLPHTVYATAEQIPPVSDYDVSHGFTYMYLKGEPLFAFGHGLSYTTFDYSRIRLSANQVRPDGTVTVCLEVKNTGDRAGDEVVQLYVHERTPAVIRPAKELRGFVRVTLRPGEKRPVTFTLPAGKLAYWDEVTHGFIVRPGVFDILVGSSSADIRQQTQLVVTAP